ncbi:sulfatase [Verrucomicrobiaceae bacterium N1E253]|uniref:Sulfatase n=1 Tax=Oceaniferula marina TaxID=2748318 RepID=A0A851GGU2_9BACT|nr:sulfatase [Oceaniferula marina]NWK55061.1 sulfatase [Oceaniferula marina]
MLRLRLILHLSLICLTGLATLSSSAASATASKANILLFVVDDMGIQDTSVPFTIDAHGNNITTPLNRLFRTPNMKSLTESGIKFTRAYAMPVCSPTRVCLMTGLNSARHHVTNWTSPYPNGETGNNTTKSHNSPSNWQRGGLDTSEPPLPRLLNHAGYRTIHAGKAHFGNIDTNKNPLSFGFDVNIAGKETGHPGSYYGTKNFGKGLYQVPHLDAYHGKDIFLTEALTLEINKAITQSVKDKQPFFAYMAHYAVHFPFDPDPRFTKNYPSLKGDSLAFATMIEGMDKSLGDILAHLDELGVAENTLVIFISDNGSDSPMLSAPLRAQKGDKYEGGIRVPMIASWAKPNSENKLQQALPIPANSSTNDLVTCFDLFPTISKVAGINPRQNIDGHDLSPYLSGKPGHHRPQQLLIHFPHDHRSDYFTTYHEGDYKLIYNFADDSYELYHLTKDIGEKNNLAAKQPERVMQMALNMQAALKTHGAQWPTHATKPPKEDPFTLPKQQP